MSELEKRIAVVGGGIAGISSAIHLRQAIPNARIQILESASRVGGVIETLTGEHLIEKGADNFATLLPDALELSKLCGIEDQLIQPNTFGRQAFVLHKNRLEPIPAGFSLMQPTRVGSILSTRTLSWRGKLRLLQEFFVKAKEGNCDESLESFVVRRLGREAFENLVEPIVSGIFTADPSTLSMEATMPQFLEMERRSGGLIRGHLSAKRKDAKAAARRASGARYDQFRAPRFGMSSWIDGLASTLPSGTIRLGCEVREIVADRNDTDKSMSKWQLELFEHGQAKTEPFDAVICACPARITSKLLSPLDSNAAELIGNIDYASSAVAAVIVNRADIRERLDGFGMIVPSVAGRRTLAISYTSNKYPGRVPNDKILLRVFFGGAQDPSVASMSDDELETLAIKELGEILGWKGTLTWMQIIRWNQAMPQYTVGHVERVKSIEESISCLPAVAIAGAAYRGVGIPQCVRSGKNAAEHIAKSLQKKQ